LKDYAIEGIDKSSFIVDVIKNNDNTYTVKFADGRVFTNIEANQDNLNIIEDTLEEQADIVTKNFALYSKRESKNLHTMIGSGVCSAFISSVIANYLSILIDLGDKPTAVICGIGTITVLSMIPSGIKLAKEKSRISEGKKIRFRNKNIDKLNSFDNYENSLAGLSNKQVKRIIDNTDNPFSLIDIDKYNEEDLHKIISNIERENKFKFTYKK
jgi:hypothetical protein